MLHNTVRELINYFTGRNFTAEQWYALTRKWNKEMSNGAAAIMVGVSKARICQLSHSGALERTRRGHVSTRSVTRYINELTEKEKNGKQRD